MAGASIQRTFNENKYKDSEQWEVTTNEDQRSPVDLDQTVQVMIPEENQKNTQELRNT